MTAEIVFVRHGETAGESRTRLNGRTDVPLSDLGRDQMRRVGSALAAHRFDRVLTSPMLRARQSTSLMTTTAPEIIDGFTEQGGRYA